MTKQERLIGIMIAVNLYNDFAGVKVFQGWLIEIQAQESPNKITWHIN